MKFTETYSRRFRVEDTQAKYDPPIEFEVDLDYAEGTYPGVLTSLMPMVLDHEVMPLVLGAPALLEAAERMDRVLNGAELQNEDKEIQDALDALTAAVKAAKPTYRD